MVKKKKTFAVFKSPSQPAVIVKSTSKKNALLIGKKRFKLKSTKNLKAFKRFTDR